MKLMGPEDGMNPEKINFFSLEEYIKRIKIEDFVLEHMEETNKVFDEYFKCLSKYDNYSVIYYWIDSLAKEMKCSQAIEKHYSHNMDILRDNVFFDTLQMSHSRIKKLHQFVTEADEIEEYRTTKEIRVSRMKKDSEEEIYWWGANPEDVKKFMDDFIRFYKSTSLSVINTNPFLKSSLAHLLFVRIHPFTDGNGRTARMIHNIKFTESINKIYNSRLKICPLNLSQNILLNQPTYAKRINDIYFDLEHDSNPEINKWFDFMLSMVDEQLFFSMNRLPSLERSFQNIAGLKHTDTPYMTEKIEKMKIKTS